jgi:hypothetical protein
MAAVSRYIVKRGSDQVRTAFQRIASLCESKGIARVTLVVPQKGGWDVSDVAKSLGPIVAKALLKGQPVTITKGATMTLQSVQTFRRNASNGLLVGAHISVKDMSKLDDSWDAQAIVYLPWNDAEGQEWQATWKPETIGPSIQKLPASSLSALVEEALSQLTQSINLGTGLGHPSDKKHAERVIDKLGADGHSFDPAEVRRWAQRNGWSSKAAADLESIARKRL